MQIQTNISWVKIIIFIHAKKVLYNIELQPNFQITQPCIFLNKIWRYSRGFVLIGDITGQNDRNSAQSFI